MDIDARDRRGDTALHLAARRGHATVVQTLLKRWASVATCRNLPTAAVESSLIDDLEDRHASGSPCRDGIARVSHAELSHRVCSRTDVACHRGAKKNVRNLRDVTPLLSAAFFGQAPAVEVLLQRCGVSCVASSCPLSYLCVWDLPVASHALLDGGRVSPEAECCDLIAGQPGLAGRYATSKMTVSNRHAPSA